MLSQIIKYQKTYFHIKIYITQTCLQFSDFKSKIKVGHPREMDVVESEMTKWVTPNLWNEYKGG